MGRRDRERKQAIIAGKVRSIAQAKRDLMQEVVRRATRSLFEDVDPEAVIDTMYDKISDAVIAVLPESLTAVGTRMFSLEEVTKDKDWTEMAGRVIAGVLVKNQDLFRHMGKGYWKTRKRPGRPKGKWKFCSWCGRPFYTPISKCRQRYDSPKCYWAAYRAKDVAQSPDFARVAP